MLVFCSRSPLEHPRISSSFNFREIEKQDTLKSGLILGISGYTWSHQWHPVSEAQGQYDLSFFSLSLSCFTVHAVSKSSCWTLGLGWPYLRPHLLVLTFGWAGLLEPQFGGSNVPGAMAMAKGHSVCAVYQYNGHSSQHQGTMNWWCAWVCCRQVDHKLLRDVRTKARP